MKPGGLLALAKRTATQAENVAHLDRTADAGAGLLSTATTAQVAAVTEGERGADNYADMLAELDNLVLTKVADDARHATGADAVAVVTPPPESPTVAPRITSLQSSAEGVTLVNQTHFTATLAGEMTVWREGLDHETGTRTVTPVSMNSVRLEFAPFTVPVPAPGGGAKSVPLADLWLRSKHRREYPGGVILQPEGLTPQGCYNLWGGFGVPLVAGNAGPMIDHIYMLCDGDAGLAEYVLNWLALCVQRPGARPEVALVLRGGRGTGKGTAFRVMLKIFGRHGLHITQPKHLVGNFNSHLRAALFLFADECHWPGDKSAEGVLKGLITEPSLAVEMKGRDVFSAPNRLKLGMASNNDWIVPAGADERRYCVIDVSKRKAQDHVYFGALHTWIDGDGASIFLDYLLGRNLSAFNVRDVPSTSALDRQKIEAMPALDRWILEALDTGVGLSGDDWTGAPHRAECTVAATRLDMYCKRSAVRGTRPDSRAIGRRLAEIFSCGPATVGRIGATSQRGWTLPGLTQARTMAAAAFGLAHYVWGQV